MYRKIFKSLNIIKDKNKSSLIEELTKAPKKEKIVPRTQAYTEDAEHYADLLFLPPDNGYKYALTVIDSATREADAEPIKDKKPENVLKAIKKIWSRKYLNEPRFILKVDAGSEFLGKFKKYFTDNKIILHRARTARHRSQALVEYINLVIGKSVMTKQTNNETLTEQPDQEWVDDLPTIVSEYNKHIKDKNIDLEFMKKLDVRMNHIPMEEGTRVRVILDYPQDLNGKRLHGKFRAGDLRFEKKIRKIENVMINPGQPILYTIEGIKTTAFTIEQLKEVDDTLQELKPSKDTFNVEKLLKRKKIKGRVHFLVKWEGYSSNNNTWEPRSQLKKDIPEMIQEFENK